MSLQLLALHGSMSLVPPQVVHLAAVISVAMPNRNYVVRDSPVDASRGVEYQSLVRTKLQQVLR